MKLLSHSETSTVQPLKFGKGKVISSHTLLAMWLLIYAGIKVNPCGSRGPCTKRFVQNKCLEENEFKFVDSIVVLRGLVQRRLRTQCWQSPGPDVFKALYICGTCTWTLASAIWPCPCSLPYTCSLDDWYRPFRPLGCLCWLCIIITLIYGFTSTDFN